MKKKFQRYINIAKPFLKKHIFLITFAIFAIYIFFFDYFCLLDTFKNSSTLHELRETEKYYEKDIEEAKMRLQELMSGKEELEKFAREQYYMKEADEDVFIVIVNED